MRIFLIAWMLISSSYAFAQTIKTINYKGMIHLSKPVALRMLDFEKGSDVDETMVDVAIKKYFKQGYFKDIWADINDGNLTFHFIEGWKKDDKDILKSVVQIKKGSLYDEEKLEAAKNRIKKAIAKDREKSSCQW